MSKKQRKFADDGWAIWIDGDDTSTVYINDWLNPKGKSYVDIAVRIRGVKLSKALYAYVPFDVSREEIEDVSREIEKAEADYNLSRAAELKYGKLPELRAMLEKAEAEDKVGRENSLLRDAVTDEEIAIATQLSCKAGAHFVKTCTGVSAGAATVEDIKLMKANLSGDVKLKASAGIRTYEDAIALIEAGADRLGTSAGISIVSGKSDGTAGGY